MESSSEKHKAYITALRDGFKKTMELYPLSSENNWTPSEIKPDHAVYYKYDKETEFYWFRGETVIAKDGQAIIDYIMDYGKKKDWDPNFLSGKVTERISDSMFLTYQCYKPIYFTEGRDFYMAMATFPVNEKTRSLVGVSVEGAECPAREGFTRAKVHLGGWVFERVAEGRTKVTFIALVDPKGWLPKAVVNLASTDQALCVVAIKKQIEKL